MTKYFISVFLFIVVMSGFAQDTTITWVNQSGEPVERELAVFERHSWQENDSLWQVRDYFPEGDLQMSGTYADAETTVKHGKFSFFAQNSTKIYEGFYDHNVAEGIWNFWDENGNLMDRGKFLGKIPEGERDSILNIVRRENPMALLRMPESLKDSTWEYFHENGVRSGVEQYESGLLTEAQYWNADGTEVNKDAVVNAMPEYPGGEKQLMKYLGKNIKYPEDAMRKKIQGTVYVRFRIDEQGNVENAEIVRSVTPSLDKEALRIIDTFPRWQPGIAQNRFIKVDYFLPVRFALR